LSAVLADNSGAAKTATVTLNGKTLAFPMPASGWATVYVVAA